MAKEKAPPPPADDIPAWFMTYSDVITLLMTFFILLLTFATTEPERFEKIQVAMFGGAGSTGIVGDPPDGIEQDSWATRTRPPSARMCLRGSEMPPIHSDPNQTTPSDSIEGLDNNKFDDLADQYTILLDVNKIVSSSGEVFAIGRQQAIMLAKQMFRLPMHVTFEVSSKGSLKRAVEFANYIFKTHDIKPGQMGVRLVKDLAPNQMRIVIEHHLTN